MIRAGRCLDRKGISRRDANMTRRCPKSTAGRCLDGKGTTLIDGKGISKRDGNTTGMVIRREWCLDREGVPTGLTYDGTVPKKHGGTMLRQKRYSDGRQIRLDGVLRQERALQRYANTMENSAQETRQDTVLRKGNSDGTQIRRGTVLRQKKGIPTGRK